MIVFAVGIISILVIVPLVNVFYVALGDGLAAYWHNLFGDRDNIAAIRLTLFVTPIAVVLNLVFGVAAAWAIGFLLSSSVEKICDNANSSPK